MKITDLLTKQEDKLEFERSVLDVINNAINSYQLASFKPAGAINANQANKSYRDNKISSPVSKKTLVTPKQIPQIPLYPDKPEKRSW
jgi:hypothetical protein